MHELLAFLQSQRLLAISASGDEPWIANVYYGIDDDFSIYFVSSEDTRHSQAILKNSMVAFSTAWYDAADHGSRKAVQAMGTCTIATSLDEITKGVTIHNRDFPEFAGRITTEWIQDESNTSHIWIIKPTYIKFWNDELYGDDEIKEFSF